jgi:hypothetical protein
MAHSSCGLPARGKGRFAMGTITGSRLGPPRSDSPRTTKLTKGEKRLVIHQHLVNYLTAGCEYFNISLLCIR